MAIEQRPVEISANRTTHKLTVKWTDGHSSVYPFNLLRAACPCATCRGGHENMTGMPDDEMFVVDLGETPATHLLSITSVGTYAISIEWEDGHKFGIYTWRYLRALCPCPICRPKE